MLPRTLKLIDLYKINPRYFNTDETVQEEVNKIIEYRIFKQNILDNLKTS